MTVVLIIDETALLEQGQRTAGVVRQYAGGESRTTATNPAPHPAVTPPRTPRWCTGQVW